MKATKKQLIEAIRIAHANIVQSTYPNGLDNAPPETKQAVKVLRKVMQ